MAVQLSFSRRAALAALLIPVAARSQAPAAAVMPLPQLPATVELRTRYFHNPRFPRADARLLASVLVHARRLAREHLGLALEFDAPAEIAIDQGFAHFGAREVAKLAPTLFDFKRGTGDRARLVEGTRRDLERSGSSLDSMLRYAQPHLLQPPASADFQGLAQAVVQTQLARIGHWRDLKGGDGRPLLDESPYNEFMAWLSAAAAGPWPYEVILTNQLIASVEMDFNHLHSALRGGVTNGITTQSPQSRDGLVSVLSLYPFTSNDQATLELRGGVPAQGDEPALWAAALLVHELGHQLLHLNHPFARAACVMNPPPMLRFREWVAGLDGKACPLGSSAEMKPGAIRFTEIRRAAAGQ